MQLAEVDGVHQIAGGDAFNIVEEVGIGVASRLIGIQIAREVGQCIVRRRGEV